LHVVDRVRVKVFKVRFRENRCSAERKMHVVDRRVSDDRLLER
jgi:hypothetical protein